MNATLVPLAVTSVIVAVGSALGFYAGARYKMDFGAVGCCRKRLWGGARMVVDGRRSLHHVRLPRR